MTRRQKIAAAAIVAAVALTTLFLGLKPTHERIACRETVTGPARSASNTAALPVPLAGAPPSAATSTPDTFGPPRPSQGLTGATNAPAIPPIMALIAKCESGGRQFYADGSLVIGKIDPDDRGKWQINRRYWGARAAALGHDIDTLEGNTAMALWIYRNVGTDPWYPSAGCWRGDGLTRSGVGS